MEPCAITGVDTRDDGDRLVVRTADGREARLDPVTAFVWRQSDGRTTPAELTRRVEGRFGVAGAARAVWQALDDLADEGLLVARVAPPTGTLSRRALFRAAAVGAAAAATGSLLAAEERRKAGAEEQGVKVSAERQHKYGPQEQNVKYSAESQVKAGGPGQERNEKLAASAEQERKSGAGLSAEQNNKFASAPYREQSAKASGEQKDKASGGLL